MTGWEIQRQAGRLADKVQIPLLSDRCRGMHAGRQSSDSIAEHMFGIEIVSLLTSFQK